MLDGNIVQLRILYKKILCTRVVLYDFKVYTLIFKKAIKKSMFSDFFLHPVRERGRISLGGNGEHENENHKFQHEHEIFSSDF